MRTGRSLALGFFLASTTMMAIGCGGPATSPDAEMAEEEDVATAEDDSTMIEDTGGSEEFPE